MSTAVDVDPFASDSHPAVSFKDKPVGTTVTGTVVEVPKLVQSRDFDSGAPDFWDDAKTQPKMSVVTVIEINGEKFGLWCQKPSAMFAAISAAQDKAGSRIAVGGTLSVTFTGETPNIKNPRLNPIKQYSVVYQPADAFGAETPAVKTEQPWVAPTAANAGHLGEAAGAVSPDDLVAKIKQVKELSAMGVPAGVVSTMTGIDMATIAAVLAAPVA